MLLQNLTVVAVRVDAKPVIETIANTLSAFHELVGGYIEAIRVFDDDTSVILVCNEEGRLLRLPPNRRIADNHGVAIDVIHGDFVFCAVNANGEFCSLTEKQASRCIALCS